MQRIRGGRVPDATVSLKGMTVLEALNIHMGQLTATARRLMHDNESESLLGYFSCSIPIEGSQHRTHMAWGCLFQDTDRDGELIGILNGDRVHPKLVIRAIRKMNVIRFERKRDLDKLNFVNSL